MIILPASPHSVLFKTYRSWYNTFIYIHFVTNSILRGFFEKNIHWIVQNKGRLIKWHIFACGALRKWIVENKRVIGPGQVDRFTTRRRQLIMCVMCVCLGSCHHVLQMILQFGYVNVFLGGNGICSSRRQCGRCRPSACLFVHEPVGALALAITILYFLAFRAFLVGLFVATRATICHLVLNERLNIFEY